MKYEKKELKYLFFNIKNGDFLGFYKKPWYFLFAKLIAFITGNKLSHIAGVFDVNRINTSVFFKLGEQLVSSGKVINLYSIIKIEKDGDDYLIDSRFTDKHQDFYLLENEFELTKEQNQIVKDYWSKKEDYDLGELAFTQNWFYNLFGKKNKIYDGNCSTAARESMRLCGIVDSKFDDAVPNPAEFAKFSYIKKIVKICF